MRITPSILALVAMTVAAVAAQDSKPATSKPSSWLPVQQKGFAYLMSQQKNGTFGARGSADVGITALCLSALQTKPKAARTKQEQKAIDQGLDWLLTQQDESGVFRGRTPNYYTCAAVQALAASGEERFRDSLKKAQRFLVAAQHAEGKGFSKEDPDYGSYGYGGEREGRGDLSNLSFAVEALRASGLPAEDEAFQKAIVFLERSQNLRAHNATKTKGKDPDTGETKNVESGDDGGAFYYPGNSPMGYAKLEDGTLIARSYGSMTYALLKAYLLAGLPKDDARVKAAVGWIAKNWTVAENPGADPKKPQNDRYDGLYYQYLLMAKALRLAGMGALEAERSGKREPIDWRKELRVQLEKTQKQDGSWVNEKSERFWENLPVLVTAYALGALGEAEEP